MMAAVQRRTGPYNVGYFGLFHYEMILGIISAIYHKVKAYTFMQVVKAA